LAQLLEERKRERDAQCRGLALRRRFFVRRHGDADAFQDHAGMGLLYRSRSPPTPGSRSTTRSLRPPSADNPLVVPLARQKAFSAQPTAWRMSPPRVDLDSVVDIAWLFVGFRCRARSWDRMASLIWLTAFSAWAARVSALRT
jgi:hypothetical protein